MIFPYAIETAVFMTVLYLGYKLLFGNATFHSFKRKLLLILLAASLVFPLFMPLFYRETSEVSIEIGLPMVSLVEPPIGAETPSISIPWKEIAFWTYVAGAFLVLLHSAIMLVRLVRLKNNSTPLEDQSDVRINPEVPGPFSWGGVVMIRPSDCDENIEMVLSHERAHLRARHWIDLMAGRLVLAFQWFSPAAWLMYRELKTVHEFEADATASLDAPYDYQMMLIKKTVGPNFPVLADSLKSNLKIRLTMMMSKRSPECRRWLAGLLLPMACMAAVGLSQPAAARILESLRSTDAVSNSKVSDYPLFAQEDENLSTVSDTEKPADASGSTVSAGESPEHSSVVEQSAESTPSFNPGQGKSEEGTKGEKPVIFVDGKLFTGSLETLSPSQIAEMTIRKDMPEYPQGAMFITLVKGDSNNAATATGSTKKITLNRSDVLTTAEELAEFPGGMSGLREWMKTHIQYPSSGGTGKVIVKLVVEKDGKVSTPQIVISASPDMDKEALRVVSEMPNWSPAKIKGEPVATWYFLPILFKEDKSADTPAEE